MKKYDFLKVIKDYGIVTLGVILVSFGIQYFYAPNQIAGGGLSGMALVIGNYIPNLSVGTLIFIGNLILFTVAFLVVGGEFGLKTIYASVMLSVVMDFMEKVLHSHALTENMLAAAILGTFICGSGLAIAFASNASTGGTDILAKILNKYSKFNIGVSLLLVDLLVVLAGAITFGLGKGIYSLLAVVINGLLIDKIIAKIEAKRDAKLEEKSASELNKAA